MAIRKNENPNRMISITEARYAQGTRAVKRQVELRKLLKPVNVLIKNITDGDEGKEAEVKVKTKAIKKPK